MGSARLDDIVSLAFFARVVEAGSFKGAADVLGVSRPAVSQRIAALEKRCGVRLFHRSTRRVTLTLEGERVYAGCAGLTRAADEITPELDRLSDAPRGRLRVSAPVGFGSTVLVPMLPEFSKAFPEVSVDLTFTEQPVDLIEAGVDVAIHRAQALPDSSYGCRKLGTDRMLVCAAPSYLAKHGAPRDLAELRRHACLELAAPRKEWSFNVGDELLTITTAGPLRCDSVLALRDAAVLGLGLAILPRSIAQSAILAGDLVVVLEEHATDMNIWALFPDQKVSAKARVFVEHLARSLRGGRLG
jgi:DNA-binding transcriptional LysR family regulator